MDPLIRVNNLFRTYLMGDIEVRALQGISLDIYAKEFVAIMGASGSGKSTFMNIIGCLDRPTSGQYFLEGKDVGLLDRDELAELRNKKLGFIFQSFNILPRTSALENVELPLLYDSSVKAAERKERAYQALRSVGLADRANSFPNQLSGGEQQRVAIARALVNQPVVIMADEPTGNLDTRTSYEIMEIFQSLNDKGSTIIMVTHEPDIAQLALSNLVFRDGKVISNNKVTNRRNARTEIDKIISLSETP